MWSLYEKKEENGKINEKKLEPLVFSNGKSQEDIVKEILEAINQGNKVIFVHGVCGSGKCLDKDTLIFCKPDNEKYFGYYKIADLVGKEGIILSVNEEGSIIHSKFNNVRETEKKEIYKLRTHTGREICASKNHSFLTITEKGVEWRPLENLSDNSYICLPNMIPRLNNLDYDENKVKILAYLIAEGKLGDKSGSPVYTQDSNVNPDTRKDYIESLRKVFPEGEIKQDKKNVKINFRIMDTRFGTTNKLRLFIREHGLDGKKSAQKFVPKIIFNLSSEKISIFLKILFSCDGSIYEKTNISRKSKQTIIEYTTISERLIKDISILLSILSIEHTITRKNFMGIKNYSKRITISNQKGIRNFIEKIGFIGRKQKLALNLYRSTKIHKFTNIDKVPRIIREYLKNKSYSYLQLDRFLNYEEIESLKKELSYKEIRLGKLIKSPCVFKQTKIDFLREHLRKINNYIKDKNISFICNENISWHKVKSIAYLKKDKTYDLEVEKYNNLIADGIIVHNSAIALNLAKELGKTSIVVPIKSLQKQYEHDYTDKKYIFKKNGEKLRIKVITGRQNHKCPYAQENKLPEREARIKKLFDFSHTLKEIEPDLSCDNVLLPCKIEIKEKNSKAIYDYLKRNEELDADMFANIKDITRRTLAPICPYWSPVLPDLIELNLKAEKKVYEGLSGKKFTIYQRKKGCPYYEQFLSYFNSDVLIFNSEKYKLETVMDRKPATELEIIDECDEFLDNLSNSQTINLNKLNIALGNLYSNNDKINRIINELSVLVKSMLNNPKIDELIDQKKILKVKETQVSELLRLFIESYLLDYVECDEENYCFHVDEVARTFKNMFDQTYAMFELDEKDIYVKLVTIDLEKRFSEFIEKNKILILMSGTIQSEKILKDVFGIKKFKIIEAETKMPGSITIQRTNQEFSCSYENFQKGFATRKKYLEALNLCINSSKKPSLVHVTAFNDLPTEHEARIFNLDIMTKEKLLEEQKHDKLGKKIQDFKEGRTKILYTTKCSRGADFPKEMCNSVILTRYPYPNVSSIFWQILKREKPEHYRELYMDKARRELLQRIYRALRSPDDHVLLLSPDIRVLMAKI